MKHNFEERRINRIAYAKSQAEKKEHLSVHAYEQASSISQNIPFGQPILVGHHSEKRHRSDAKKIDSAMRKSVELAAEADHYCNKAASIEKNAAIFSDDPNALAKLEEKISTLEGAQEAMKAANKAIRLNKTDDNRKLALLELGFSEVVVNRLLAPAYGRQGFAAYELTNNNANIRRLKERLESIKKVSETQSRIEIIGMTQVIFNVEANRVQVLFPSMPSEATREELSSKGFRWCRSEGVWQRHLNDHAFALAKQIVANDAGQIGD